MTPERLEQLADAWGADLRRWPDADRAAAHALLARDAGARAVLARAAALDAALDLHAVAPPDVRLQRAVLAGAPGVADDGRRRVAGKRGGWQLSRGWWWPGAGLAGVGLAGTVAGAMVVAMALSAVVPAPRSASSTGGAWASTVFDSGNAAEWSEE